MNCSWERFFLVKPDRGILDRILPGVDDIPGIIDRELIVDSFYETCSPEYKQSYKKGDVPYVDIDKLALERKCILKIDHLWMLENLTVLSLAHNDIERVENLNELKNLTELNLSFNKIKVMEGLEGLNKLEVIIFFGNKIECVSGLLHQEGSLRILNIANNEVNDPSCIKYLQSFTKLVSLNMAGNPISSPAFRERALVYLSDLIYYDNEYITDAERNDARAALEAELKEKAELEAAKARYMKKLNAHKRKLDFCNRAFVDGLDKNDFFHKMFQKDLDGRVFKDDTDKFEDAYDRLRALSFDVSCKIYDAGARNIVERYKEVKQFKIDTKVNAALGQKRLTHATAKISSKLNALLEKSKNYFKGPMTKQLKKDPRSLKLWLQGLDMLKEFVNNFLDDQWFYLMSVEMKNFEKNEETINTYDRRLAEVITVFVEEIQSQFTRLRDAENDCHQEVSNRLMKLMNDTYQKDEFYKLPKSFQSRMQDKETLNNSIDSSHDFHLLAIDMKEDSIMSRLKMWHKQQTGDLMNDEMMRNRKIVLQIHNYINNQKKEFEQQICGILNFFKFLEPDDNFEENLDMIIQQWLGSKSAIFEIPSLGDENDDSKDEVPEELKEVFSIPFLHKDISYVN